MPNQGRGGGSGLGRENPPTCTISPMIMYRFYCSFLSQKQISQYYGHWADNQPDVSEGKRCVKSVLTGEGQQVSRESWQMVGITFFIFLNNSKSCFLKLETQVSYNFARASATRFVLEYCEFLCICKKTNTHSLLDNLFPPALGARDVRDPAPVHVPRPLLPLRLPPLLQRPLRQLRLRLRRQGRLRRRIRRARVPRGLQVYKRVFFAKKPTILVVICTHGVTVLKSGGSFGVKTGQSAMLMGSF